MNTAEMFATLSAQVADKNQLYRVALDVKVKHNIRHNEVYLTFADNSMVSLRLDRSDFLWKVLP